MRQLGGTAEAGGTYIGGRLRTRDRRRERHGVELDRRHARCSSSFASRISCSTARSFVKPIGPTHPANDFPGPTSSICLGTYHRVLTMRDKPVGGARATGSTPAHAALDVSAHEWLTRLGLSERAIALAYGINVSFGRDAHDVSALLLLFRGAFSKAQRALAPAEQHRLHGARRRAAHTRSDGGGARRRRRARPRRRRRSRSSATAPGSRARTARGSRATHVIAAVPLGVLRRIAIEPTAQRRSGTSGARRCPRSRLTQVYLAPRQPFWEQDGYAPSLFTDTRAGMLAAARNGDDPTEVTSLTAWITGDAAAALDRFPPDEAGRRRDRRRSRRCGPRRGASSSCIGVHSWGADPYAAGAWAYFRPGQVTRSRPPPGPLAWPPAFLRRASRDDEPRHGGRDGVGRSAPQSRSSSLSMTAAPRHEDLDALKILCVLA